MSGLSDTMSPGSISNLSLSGEIAFRAKFEGEHPAEITCCTGADRC